MSGVRPGVGVSAWRGGITRAESRRATDSRGRRSGCGNRHHLGEEQESNEFARKAEGERIPTGE